MTVAFLRVDPGVKCGASELGRPALENIFLLNAGRWRQCSRGSQPDGQWFARVYDGR